MQTKTRQTLQKASNVYNKSLIVLSTIAIAVVMIRVIDAPVAAPPQEEVVAAGCAITADQFLETVDTSLLTTNTQLSLIDFEQELYHSALGKNAIPPISKPIFSSFAEMDNCIEASDTVVVVESDTEVKVYAKKILDNHIVVNDMIGSAPLAVTSCAVCHSFAVYSREYKGDVLAFGTTGKLYRNNDVLYDDKTESLWTQFQGKAIVGSSIGAKLDRYPYRVMSYKRAKELFPDARVLSFDTGFRMDYATDNTVAFEASDTIYGLTINDNDELARKTVVYGFEVEGEVYAFESDLDENESFTVGDQELVVADEGEEVSATLDGETIELRQAYWYVWADFYPETIVLE